MGTVRIGDALRHARRVGPRLGDGMRPELRLRATQRQGGNGESSPSLASRLVAKESAKLFFCSFVPSHRIRDADLANEGKKQITIAVKSGQLFGGQVHGVSPQIGGCHGNGNAV